MTRLNLECKIIKESKLFFGNNQPTIDPKVGLLNFGPYGTLDKNISPTIITAGVISTNEYLENLKTWLERLSYRIEGRTIFDSGVRGIDFPGINKESPLKFELKILDSAVEIITKQELLKALKSENRKDRILQVFDIYKQKFSDMSGNHPKPDIIILPLDEEIIDNCKDKRFKQDKIVFERRTFDKSKKFEHIPLFDFHNALKVLAIKYGMVTQLIRPSTLKFSHDVQDEATIAWNFAVAIYYKGTGVPWKLADIDDQSCFVGLSFYQEISKDSRNMRTSMAHVYMKTGESQIIRGNSFRWDPNQGLTPQLSEENASLIINNIISLYQRQKGRLPRRIVIHKSSHFSQEEISGFNRATKGIELVDYVHIVGHIDIRSYPEGFNYPTIRGTLFGRDNYWFLYTTGYIPSLGTYPGSTIPEPLGLEIVRSDSNYYTICKDIIALTKLDWNTADFCRREPVTLSVSKKVGEILSELHENDVIDPPSGYRYYM
jgi:hypothetical protein